MEYLKTDLSDNYVTEQLAVIETKFTSVDALAPLADQPVIDPEMLTDAEIDQRFNEAVDHIQQGTSPEEREAFRKGVEVKISGKDQIYARKDL